MKVLMIGFEFPPFIAGGLGTACFGLTKSLANKGMDITFVMPKVPGEIGDTHVNIVDASKAYINSIEKEFGIKVKTVDTLIQPYMSPETYMKMLKDKRWKHRISTFKDGVPIHGRNFYEESELLIHKIEAVALAQDFDVIHAHDWMTYHAGVRVKELTGKPLILHIHNTVFDRYGGNCNSYEYDAENIGFAKADLIYAVSQYTKDKIVQNYGVDANKVEVVHNGMLHHYEQVDFRHKLRDHYPTVLFMGRVTLQKGPDWFLHTAKCVLRNKPETRFIMVGSGDMENQVIEQAADMGIGANVIFHPFARGKEVDMAYKSADLFILPSVSEPFGIMPLEAASTGIFPIVSKQMGSLEVIPSMPSSDFWDTELMASQICHFLDHPQEREERLNQIKQEVKNVTWDVAADKCINGYRRLHK